MRLALLGGLVDVGGRGRRLRNWVFVFCSELGRVVLMLGFIEFDLVVFIVVLLFFFEKNFKFLN